jgi:hypothetical protein
MTRLNRQQLRLIIEGLRLADDGCTARSKKQKAAGSELSGQRQISTSSVSFREQLIQACLHAGFSAHFSINSRAGGVRGYKAVPTDYRLYSKKKMEQLQHDDPTRVFQEVRARYDSWWVNYSPFSTSALLDAADVRYDGKALQRREKRKDGEGYVALHLANGTVVRRATQRELAEAIGIGEAGVLQLLRRCSKKTLTGWRIFNAADYDERAGVTSSAPAAASAAVIRSSSHAASLAASASAAATTKTADAYSLRDGRTWCVNVRRAPLCRLCLDCPLLLAAHVRLLSCCCAYRCSTRITSSSSSARIATAPASSPRPAALSSPATASATSARWWGRPSL